MGNNWGCCQEQRVVAATILFTCLLFASWLLLLRLGWAVTRATSQPDHPAISLKQEADALLLPPALHIGDKYRFA